MKKIFFLLLLSLSIVVLHAQYVTIPDTAFVSWLNNNGFASCMNGNQLDTTCVAVLNADTLVCSNVPVRDLTGIQYFKNLTGLSCYNDSLTFIPSFPSSLIYINCEYNLLATLPPLPPGIVIFGCSFNKLDSLPVIPSTLQNLTCESNFLSYLPVLPDSMTFLQCFNDRLIGLPVLPVNLRYLICYKNQLDSLPGLPSLLYELDCSYNHILALPTLPDAMRKLECIKDSLTVLPALPSFLTNLECDNNRISALPVLPTSLQLLSCSGNPLLMLPVLPNALTELFCNDDSLTALPELPDSMSNLNCSYNSRLTCLPYLKTIVSFNFDSTGIGCLPDYGNIANSFPPLSSFPLCATGNVNGCTIYTGIDKVIAIANVSIYPNPTNSKLEIALQNIPTGYLQVSIADVSGQVLSKENVNVTGKTELDVSELPAGLYFLTARSNAESWVRRFVKN